MNVPKLRFKEFTDEWEFLPAEKLFSNINEKNFPNENVLTIIQGKGTVLRTQSGRDILFDESRKNTYKKVQRNDFIIHLRSFEAGLEIANSNGIVSPAYTILRNKIPIATMFYRNYFRSNKFINQILRKAVEGIRDGKQISYSQFKKLPIIYASLDEQKKIANFLSTVDKKISNLEDIIINLENQKKGLLQQIFNQKLRFKDENGNNYPDWKHKQLGDIATLKNGISKGNEAFGHGKKFINLQDIFNKSYIFNDNYSLVDVTEKELSENNLLKGDVLFVRSSVKREGVGLPCVIMENLIDTVYSGFIIRCRFNTNENIYLHYKKYCFLESSFRKALLKKSSSSANTNINQDNLSKLYVKLPCLEEQTKIADFLSAFDRKIDNQKAQLEHWKQIIGAIIFITGEK